MNQQEKIGMFKLRNDGGFVVRLDTQYRTPGTDEWDRVNLTNDILLGQNTFGNPGDHGVPDGADVRLYADVAGGPDKTANQIYTYKSGNNHVAKYLISGVVTQATLALIKRT